MEERFAEVLEAVSRTHKSGTITLKIDVKPAKDPLVNQVGIFADVSGTVPHVERTPEWLYVDRNGNLSRRDPRQPEPSLHIPAHEPLDGKSRAAGERE